MSDGCISFNLMINGGWMANLMQLTDDRIGRSKNEKNNFSMRNKVTHDNVCFIIQSVRCQRTLK